MDYYHEVIKTAAEGIGLTSLTHAALCEAVGIPKAALARVTGKSYTEWVGLLTREGVAACPPTPRARVPHAGVRKRMILDVALELAEAEGLGALSARRVAEACGVSRPLVQRYIAGYTLKEVVIQHAKKRGSAKVLAEAALENKHRAALDKIR